jgi:HlyD family secretion protein
VKRRAIAAGLCLLGLPACGATNANSSAPPPIAVEVTNVGRSTIAATELLDGQVDPYLQASLAPQQSGTLVAVYANEGDRVRKNAVLAKIDDAVLRANLTQQQGAALQASAKLAQSQIQLPITDVSAHATLAQDEHALALARKTQIADAANVANTKLTFGADRTLLAQGYVSSTTFQQANAAYVAAQQTLASDTDKLAQAQAALRQARQSLANTPLQRQVIVENRGAVVQSEGSVQQYRTAIGQTTLSAPFDGVVTARTLDPGAFASPNQAIFVISQIDPVYIDFNLKDTDLAYVAPGTAVTFTTSAHAGRQYRGRVASVNAQPTPGTLLYRARIVESNPDFSLRGGLLVSVRIVTRVSRNALTVPRAAVVQNGSTGTIYAVEHESAATPSGAARDVAREMTVHLGLQTDDDVAISGPGVRAGMSVVLGQVDNLRDGASVQFATAAR